MGKIAYFFTTFPKLSERFFLREVVELKKQGLDFDIYSMIGGRAESEAGPVICMTVLDWLCLPVELIYWLGCRPVVLGKLLRLLLIKRYGSWINLGENWLGFAVALRFGRRIRAADYVMHHGTWATAPGMAVYVLKQLLGRSYTLEAHAYDVFRDGGDAFLELKLRHAEAIRSSTEATTAELVRLLKSEGDFRPPVYCIRRGLETIPKYVAPGLPEDGILKIISVGRLIEKKGYFNQLKIYGALSKAGVDFRATIVGDGPLFSPLKAAIMKAGLTSQVHLSGKLEYQAVHQLYLESDLFLFTGMVSGSGDRDGFPNVIGEAMAQSIPVFSTDVSGTTEGVLHGKRGFVIDALSPERTATEIVEAMRDMNTLEQVTREAHAWIAKEFQIESNVTRLRRSLWETTNA